MKHRALPLLALIVLAFSAVAASATAAGGMRLFQFRGELVNASSTSVQVKVEGGNRPALRAMLGQSQDQSFTIGPKTEILVWRKGIPTVGSVTDLKQGDWVVVNVRAPIGSSLAQVEAAQAGIVGDHLRQPNPSLPLFLFVGTVGGPQSGGHIALHVTAGNRLALRRMLGQPQDQTFTYNDGTIFLLWQGKVPSVIDAAKLVVGDRIVVRIRAAMGSSLAQVESTAAKHIGDREPAGKS